MTDLTRWVDADLPPQVRRMLDAAQREAPSPEVLQRSLAAVAGAGAVTMLAAHATGGAATAGSAAGASGTAAVGVATKAGAGTAIGLAKWGVVGLVSGVVAVGAVDGAQRAFDPQPVATPPGAISAIPATDPGRLPAALPAQPSPEPAASELPARPSAAFPLVDSAPAFDDGPSQLAVEIRMVEQARAALREGRLDAAVTSAGAYRKRFPRGQFAPELDYIRMEALDRQGNHAAAAQAARQLIARHPGGPQSLRARQILEREQR